MSELTPVMKQYMDIKNAHRDSIVLFRLGDFYEMFGEDAKIASSILQITLTTRNKSSKEPLPMCGVPHHAVEPYVKKLVDAGQKVVICEQVEDAATAKGIVKREVDRVITPGTYEPESPKENSYILSFKLGKKAHGICVCELSKGEIFVYESSEALDDEINRFGIKEILCPKSLRGDIHYGVILKDLYTTYYDDYYFDHTYSYPYLLNFFNVATLESYGCDDMHNAIGAAGALLTYLSEGQNNLGVFNKLKVFNTGSHMFIEKNAINNLELISNKKTQSVSETLFGILDNTLTPMGGRFLRDSIVMPLTDIFEIQSRLDAVYVLFENFQLREELRHALSSISDLERIVAKIINGRINARDLFAVKISVESIPTIKSLLGSIENKYLNFLNNTLPEFKTLVTLIDESIIDSPPFTIKEGGIIKDGYNKDVDEFRMISKKGKTFLTELEAKEKEKTGINSLKINYNKVFGYYIEVTKANLHLVPEHFIRKQTLVNSERFITPELKEYENKIIGAQDKLRNLEYQLFKDIAEQIKEYAKDLRQTAASIALVDFMQSMAKVAKDNNYSKPAVNETCEITIKGSRHPIIENTVKGDKFVPNDTMMDTDRSRLLVITGPNMAGKSTYMRQTALVVIMAQMGSFVPAESAKIGIVDRVFTRIGASDYITKGQSTFMVEMVETANIVNNATKKSLILLDEVGRGTSTFDGISIAWAVAEYIVNVIGARTLFATHYNELTELAHKLEGVINYNVSVKEWGEEIIFVRKIVRGAADKSYGIQVARLAGIPDDIIKRAREVLTNLEKDEVPVNPDKNYTSLRKQKRQPVQLELFPPSVDPIKSILLKTKIENLRPKDALNLLIELKKFAED